MLMILHNKLNIIIICLLLYIILLNKQYDIVTVSAFESIDINKLYSFNLTHISHVARDILFSKHYDIANNPNTLAVMILFTYGLSDSINLKQLHCSINLLNLNMYNTPMHVYVWLGKYKYGDRLPDWMYTYTNLFIMELDKDSWKVPNIPLLKDSSKWSIRSSTTIDYYLMGRWRLTFQPLFVQAMEYDYFLQIDMDSYVAKPIDINLVEVLRNNNIYFSTTNLWHVNDKREVLNGLAEFTRFWLVTSGYNPMGEIFQNTMPSNMDGLYTHSSNIQLGWNLLVHRGNFMLIDIHKFWFNTIAQDYLLSVLRSGYDIEQRWQEQGSMCMYVYIYLCVYTMLLYI